MVNHANNTFFEAVELAGQEGKADEAVSMFEKAIHLYSVIATSTSSSHSSLHSQR